MVAMLIRLLSGLLSEYVKRVMMQIEIILCAGAFNYLIYPGVMKLEQDTCFSVYQVIMLSGLVCLLILRLAAAEFMSDHQLAVDQQLNGVVESSPRYAIMLVVHEIEKQFNIEMSVPRIDFIKDSESLRRLSHRMTTEILGKDLLYNCPGVFTDHYSMCFDV